jgi:multiple sugar transport system permease protein
MTPTLPQPRRTSRLQRSENLAGYLFILPGIIGLCVFVLYPLFSSMYYALTQWDGATAPKFIGLENFIYYFTQDLTFWPSVRATLVWVALSVPTGVAAGLLLALLVNRSLPGITVFRTVLYLPTILPVVASLALWKFIYNPTVGLANQLLNALGLPSSLWLGDVNLVFPALLAITLWSAGGAMVIFLAGLQSVPTELYEAARLDGASDWHLFWHITVPMISPVLLLQTVTGVIGALQSLAQPQLITGGGPDLATNFLMFKVWTTAFVSNQFGQAIALVWVLFVMIMVATAATFRLSNAFVYAEDGAE